MQYLLAIEHAYPPAIPTLVKLFEECITKEQQSCTTAEQLETTLVKHAEYRRLLLEQYAKNFDAMYSYQESQEKLIMLLINYLPTSGSAYTAIISRISRELETYTGNHQYIENLAFQKGTEYVIPCWYTLPVVLPN